MQMTVSTTDKRDGKALALFAQCADWQTGYTKDGRSFFAIPGSERGLFHMADQNDCSCPDRQKRREVCKHMRAIRFWMVAFKAGAVAPKPRPATPDVIDDLGIGDELVILTPDGAAYLAELAAAELPEGWEPARDDEPTTDPHADCIVTDEMRERLAERKAKLDRYARSMRLFNFEQWEIEADAHYVELREQIAKIEACIAAADERVAVAS